MQSSFGNDVYPTLEEKAAHFLYLIIKNHPFNDGNKRTGAFTFLWFLKKSGLDTTISVTPNTPTALTLLVAQSDPSDKDRVIGLVLLMFR
jgi:prophage maintenance system killer protein